MTDFNGLNATVQPWSPSPQQLATLKFVAAMNKPGMKIAAVAVIAADNIDLARLMTPDITDAVWTVERGCLDEFLRNPALRGYQQHGVPVIAYFEDGDDLKRCRAAFGPPAATDA
jgi:hypothetical protein